MCNREDCVPLFYLFIINVCHFECVCPLIKNAAAAAAVAARVLGAKKSIYRPPKSGQD